MTDARARRRVGVVVFTRDVRLHDNPALTAAVARVDEVVPVFVFDDVLLAGPVGSPGRTAFLIESLRDLHASLQAIGAGLLVRRGEWLHEVMTIVGETNADEIHIADDVSGFAQRRLDALQVAADGARVALHRHVGITVVPAYALRPLGRDNYSVFTPYWRAWAAHPWRTVLKPPAHIKLAARLAAEGASGPGAQLDRMPAMLPPGFEPGETAGRRHLARWVTTGLAGYEQNHDDLAGASTSRLSAFLHFGCLSPLEVATSLRGLDGGPAFVRQLGWRDFFHQFVAPQPDVLWRSYRPDGAALWAAPPERARERWEAWVTGRTGVPIVDAAMRQLDTEGFVHNRARMVAASFLTKDLGLPWWDGARHYLSRLVDADVVVNNMNWQWVAGTGTDTNRHRVLKPTRQAERFDPAATYITRYLPELAGLPAKLARDPDAATRRAVGYPAPILGTPAA